MEEEAAAHKLQVESLKKEISTLNEKAKEDMANLSTLKQLQEKCNHLVSENTRSSEELAKLSALRDQLVQEKEALLKDKQEKENEIIDLGNHLSTLEGAHEELLEKFEEATSLLPLSMLHKKSLPFVLRRCPKAE